MVEHEQEHLLREYAEELAGRGVDVENAGIEWPKLAEEMKPPAERRVHARLLLDAVADRDAVTVDEDEFERTLLAIGRAEGKSAGEVRQTLDENGRLQRCAARSGARRRCPSCPGMIDDARHHRGAIPPRLASPARTSAASDARRIEAGDSGDRSC